MNIKVNYVIYYVSIRFSSRSVLKFNLKTKIENSIF